MRTFRILSQYLIFIIGFVKFSGSQVSEEGLMRYNPQDPNCLVQPGFYWDEQACQTCRNSLCFCKERGGCDQCVDGYTLGGGIGNNYCQKCPTGCASCCKRNSVTQFVCRKCMPGYKLKSGSCIFFPDCLEIDTVTVRCKKCENQFYLDQELICRRCHKNCLKCFNRYTCSECQEGYYKNIDEPHYFWNPLSQLQQGDNDENFFTIIDGQALPYDGEYDDSNGWAIVSCLKCQIPDCQVCDLTQDKLCDVCKEGFFISKDRKKCQPCADNCIQCDSDGECLECDFYYYCSFSAQQYQLEQIAPDHQFVYEIPPIFQNDGDGENVDGEDDPMNQRRNLSNNMNQGEESRRVLRETYNITQHKLNMKTFDEFLNQKQYRQLKEKLQSGNKQFQNLFKDFQDDQQSLQEKLQKDARRRFLNQQEDQILEDYLDQLANNYTQSGDFKEFYLQTQCMTVNYTLNQGKCKKCSQINGLDNCLLCDNKFCETCQLQYWLQHKGLYPTCTLCSKENRDVYQCINNQKIIQCMDNFLLVPIPSSKKQICLPIFKNVTLQVYREHDYADLSLNLGPLPIDLNCRQMVIEFSAQILSFQRYCITCHVGWVLLNTTQKYEPFISKICRRCNIPHCQKCQDQEQRIFCQECYQTYYLSKDAQSCIKCPQSCIDCSTTSDFYELITDTNPTTETSSSSTTDSTTTDSTNTDDSTSSVITPSDPTQEDDGELTWEEYWAIYGEDGEDNTTDDSTNDSTTSDNTDTTSDTISDSTTSQTVTSSPFEVDDVLDYDLNTLPLGFCRVCDIGYRVTNQGTCEQCTVEKCSECAVDQNVCAQCRNGYGLADPLGTLCWQCQGTDESQNTFRCLKCDLNFLECQLCNQEKYYLQDGQCAPNPQFCQFAEHDGFCILCEAKNEFQYKAVNGFCVECQNQVQYSCPQNCLESKDFITFSPNLINIYQLVTVILFLYSLF